LVDSLSVQVSGDQKLKSQDGQDNSTVHAEIKPVSRKSRSASHPHANDGKNGDHVKTQDTAMESIIPMGDNRVSEYNEKNCDF